MELNGGWILLQAVSLAMWIAIIAGVVWLVRKRRYGGDASRLADIEARLERIERHMAEHQPIEPPST